MASTICAAVVPDTKLNCWLLTSLPSSTTRAPVSAAEPLPPLKRALTPPPASVPPKALIVLVPPAVVALVAIPVAAVLRPLASFVNVNPYMLLNVAALDMAETALFTADSNVVCVYVWP